MASLLANLTGAEAPSTSDSVWQSLAAAVPVLAGLNHAAIPTTGVALDATAWKALPFIEGKSLRYDPTPRS
jgi:NADH-quinone oxidoreductase subunit G